MGHDQIRFTIRKEILKTNKIYKQVERKMK